MATLAAAIAVAPAEADPSVVPALQAHARFVAGACSGGTCPALALTIVIIYPSAKARYCSVVFNPRGVNAPTSAQPVPSSFGGKGRQYRSENSWTLTQAAQQDGATLPPPTLANEQYPFTPFGAPTCDVTVGVGNGSLTVGSIEGSGEPKSFFDLRLVDGNIVGVAGSGGTAGVVIQEIQAPYTRLQ